MRVNVKHMCVWIMNWWIIGGVIGGVFGGDIGGGLYIDTHLWRKKSARMVFFFPFVVEGECSREIS